MNRIEKRIRNLINPYSTAFAGWWCHSGRYLRVAQVIPGNRAGARPRPRRPTTPGTHASTPFAARSSDHWLATQAARRTAVDEVLASLDDGHGKVPDQG